MIELRANQRIADVPEAAWNALLPEGAPPFVAWTFLDALERTGCVSPERGWLPQHLTLWEEGRLVAAAPAYVKGHSEGEFVFDWSWADSRAAPEAALLPQAHPGRSVHAGHGTSPARSHLRRAQAPIAVPRRRCAAGHGGPQPFGRPVFPEPEEAKGWEDSASCRDSAFSSSGTTAGTNRSRTFSRPSRPSEETNLGASGAT